MLPKSQVQWEKKKKKPRSVGMISGGKGYVLKTGKLLSAAGNTGLRCQHCGVYLINESVIVTMHIVFNYEVILDSRPERKLFRK